MNYRFEWNYNLVADQTSFEEVVNDVRNNEEMVNYEQLARLFCERDGEFVMIELQIPSKAHIELTGEDDKPWMDAFEVKSMDDYSCSKEIDTTIGNDHGFTFDNVEQIMLEYAMSLFN